MLARIILTCCAADARPIKIGLSGDIPAGVKADLAELFARPLVRRAKLVA